MCTFAHGKAELRDRPDWSKTRLCLTWLHTGACTNFKCRYAHSTSELRCVSTDDGSEESSAETLPSGTSATAGTQTLECGVLSSPDSGALASSSFLPHPACAPLDAAEPTTADPAGTGHSNPTASGSASSTADTVLAPPTDTVLAPPTEPQGLPSAPLATPQTSPIAGGAAGAGTAAAAPGVGVPHGTSGQPARTAPPASIVPRSSGRSTGMAPAVVPHSRRTHRPRHSPELASPAADPGASSTALQTRGPASLLLDRRVEAINLTFDIYY